MYAKNNTMRYSQLLIPTLKEAPSDAKTPSHVYLIRAGYIRQVAAGIFSILPLGMRVIQNIETIVRQELNAIGANEVLLPMVHPAPLWQESGRWQKYGPQLLRFQDRKEFDFVLAPTAEEAMVAMVRDDVKSYRKLPLHLYQIQDKFRDEDRPRAGLLRGREFVMKDGYSFHADESDAIREYQKTHQAYVRIFQRCGLDFRAVEADTGNIGGNLSHEFQVLANTGEDNLVSCSHCDYAANVEKALLKRESKTDKQRSNVPMEDVSTPNVRTISEVADFLKVSEKELVKTLVYVADGTPVAVLVRGDRQVNEPKLKTLLQVTELEPATEMQLKQWTQAEAGFLGPIGLQIPLYADWEVTEMTSFVAGANRVGFHTKHIQWGRDFSAQAVDVRVAAAGDVCGKCGVGQYRSHRGIEVGHVFFLGTKYSKAMHCEFLDRDGQLKPMTMGCYGIGITRVMAAAIEQRHDDKGICWPMALAPFHVSIVCLGQEEALLQTATQLHDQLTKLGIQVLLDDRDERPGVKFADAELIGIPLRITLGKRGLTEGVVEAKSRDARLETTVPISQAVDYIQNYVQKELS